MINISKKFRLWSQNSKDANNELKPIPNQIKFVDISDRDKLWKYLKQIFFKEQSEIFEYPSYLVFENIVLPSVFRLNDKNKYHSYGTSLLESMSEGDNKFSSKNINAAKRDFERILLTESDNVILELLSHYFQLYLANICQYVEKRWSQKENESNKDFQKRKKMACISYFNSVKEDLNDIFQQFNLPYILTLTGFIPKNDEKIIKEIYEPVLQLLYEDKFKAVNTLLSDSFDAYHKNTKQGYSESITQAISALEAYLQILIYGEAGVGGKLGNLVSTALSKGFIPNDNFSETVIKQLLAFIAKERKETGVAHPKKEYANESNCRLLINIVMVFIQHAGEM